MINSGKHTYSIGRNLDTVASNEGAIGSVPDVPSEVAILLALVVHELTTNALKYGALSSSGGRISLAWRKSDRTLYRNGSSAVDRNQINARNMDLERSFYRPVCANSMARWT